MASSGSFNTSAYSGRYLTFAWTETSQDIEDNSTRFHWTLKGAGGGSTWYMTGPIKVVIDGLTVYNSSTRIQLGNGTLVAEGNITLGHASNGAKSFVAKVEAAVYTYAVNCTGSKTFTLDTIPRKSTLTASNGTLGTAQTLTINRASNSFVHNITYKCGSATGTIATRTTSASVSWTPPLTLASQNTTGTSVSVTLTIQTFGSSTSTTPLGSTTKAITCAIPASVKPSCSLTLEDTTGWDDTYGSPVQGLSNIKVTINTTLAHGSPIASYSATANGGKFTTSSFSTGVLKASGSSPVSATVKDRRGRTGSASYTMNVQAYTKPTVSKLTVARCNQDGTANEEGGYIKATFSAAITALNSRNTAAYKIKYKKSTATSYTSVTLTALANTYTVTDHAYIFAATSDSSYDIEVEATDRHGTATRATSASTAFTLMNFGPSGKSMGVGKVAENDEGLEIGLDTTFFGATQVLGNRYCISSPGVAGTDGFVLMARIEVKTASADNPITFIFSRRLAASPMTVHVTLGSTATSSSLRSIRYEGTNYGAFLVQNSTMVWDLYIQKAGAHDTVTLQEWYTSDTMERFVALTFPGTLVTSAVPTPFYRATPLVAESILDCFMPVGYVLILYNHTDPNTMYPGSTWERIENAFLWGCDASGSIGLTGGEKTHTLTVNELPAHSHGSVYSQHATATKNKAWYTTEGSSLAYGAVPTGGGAAHNNMPPFIQVSIWRRTT